MSFLLHFFFPRIAASPTLLLLDECKFSSLSFSFLSWDRIRPSDDFRRRDLIEQGSMVEDFSEVLEFS